MKDEDILENGFIEDVPLVDTTLALIEVEEPLVFLDDEEEDEDLDDEKLPLAELESFDDAIKIYLRDIQRTPLLTAELEKECARQIEKGDRAARNKSPT